MMRYLPLLALLFSAAANAAITYRSNDSDGNNAANEQVVNKPTGTVEDDVMVAFCSAGDATVDATDWTATGWTEIGEVLSSSGFDRRTAVLYKVAGGSEPSTYTFDHGAAGTDRVQCSIATFDGVDTTTPIDVTYVQGSHYAEVENATSEIQDPPSITTVTNDAWVLIWQFISHDDWDAAGPSTGYTTRISQNVNTTLSHRNHFLQTKEVTTAGAEDADALSHTEDGTDVNDASMYVIALRPASTGPSFTTGPSVAAATNGFTISGTLSGSGTLTAYAVGVNPGDGAPTCSQIKSGNNDGGTSAALSGNEVWTTDVANDFTITDANSWVRYDVHICGSDGTTDTAVTSSNDQNRSADTSEQIVVLAAPSETGVFGVATDTTGDTTINSPVIADVTDASLFAEGYEVTVSAGFSCSPYCAVLGTTASTVTLDEDATSTQANVTLTRRSYFDPTAASGDVIELDNNTSGACAITFQTDGDFSYSASCTGLQTFDYCVQDVSDVLDGAFTTPDCWTTDDTWYVNNTAPVLDASGADEDIVVTPVSSAMDSIDYKPLCTDADSHTMTLDFVRGTIPPGLTFTGGVLSGTATTENESGAQMTMRCTDQGGLVSYEPIIIYPITTIAAPTLDDSDLPAAEADMFAAAPWRVNDLGLLENYVCGDEAAGQVLSQDPVATTEITAFENISLNISTGHSCIRRRR